MTDFEPIHRRASIPDIYITRIYAGDPDCELHYETFGRLAEVFGRNTPAHRHSRFYQIHLLLRGNIRLQLDDQTYAGDAPLVFMTPPAIPHAFYSEEHTEGHVLTVRQEVVRAWCAALPGVWPEAQQRTPAFVPLAGLAGESAAEAERLIRYATLLGEEFGAQGRGRLAALRALGQCFFISLHRLIASQGADLVSPERGEDLRIFLGFCDLVEAHFRDHLTLPDYASRLAVTEARLNAVCRRMANLASKELIHDRLVQEARRLLRFSTTPIGELSYQLGFADPAYFTRFFTRRVGLTPSQFRASPQQQPT